MIVDDKTTRKFQQKKDIKKKPPWVRKIGKVVENSSSLASCVTNKKKEKKPKKKTPFISEDLRINFAELL